MTAVPPPELPPEQGHERDHHLFGSRAADITTGIFTALLWWGFAIGAASISHGQPAAGLGAVALCFLVQLVAVGTLAKGPTTFLVTEVLTAFLLPILAAGLVFGACLFAGGGIH